MTQHFLVCSFDEPFALPFVVHFDFESFENFAINGVILGDGFVHDPDVVGADLEVLGDGPLTACD